MKLKPENILTTDQNVLFKKILITGSDHSLISHVTEFIVNKYKKNNFFIDLSGETNNGSVGDLFSDKKVLFLLKDFSSKKETLKEINNSEHFYLISAPNNTKINLIKKDFQKSKDALCVDCYALNRAGKETVLRYFIQKKNLKVSNDVFWYIVENFENEYVLLNKQLEILSFLNTEISSVRDVEKAVPVENKIEVSKIFFYILKNNKYLINVFSKNIYSQSDFYFFLNSLKLYLGIISSSVNKEDALSKFPKYLFNEKDVFIKIYNYLDKKKILKIYKNILRVEGLIRKNSGLYHVVGLRFLINTKKIIIS